LNPDPGLRLGLTEGSGPRVLRFQAPKGGDSNGKIAAYRRRRECNVALPALAGDGGSAIPFKPEVTHAGPTEHLVGQSDVVRPFPARGRENFEKMLSQQTAKAGPCQPLRHAQQRESFKKLCSDHSNGTMAELKCSLPTNVVKSETL